MLHRWHQWGLHTIQARLVWATGPMECTLCRHLPYCTELQKCPSPHPQLPGYELPWHHRLHYTELLPGAVLGSRRGNLKTWPAVVVAREMGRGVAGWEIRAHKLTIHRQNVAHRLSAGHASFDLFMFWIVCLILNTAIMETLASSSVWLFVPKIKLYV